MRKFMVSEINILDDEKFNNLHGDDKPYVGQVFLF
jgi:hypothetical protein